MCLGIPMQIESIDGDVATCQADGVFRQVNLLLLSGQSVEVGDFVIVKAEERVTLTSRWDSQWEVTRISDPVLWLRQL